MRMLIRVKKTKKHLRCIINHHFSQVFPDLAEKVFDKCITEDPNKKELKLEYLFLDDTFNYRREEGEVVEYRYVENADKDLTAEPYHPHGVAVMRNHPLMLMVKHKNKHLLRHPLCLSLLRHKWKNFGRYVFYTQFLLYILFLAAVTTYVMLDKESFKHDIMTI